MTTDSATRHRQLAHLNPAVAALRVDVARWALANGRQLDFDALTVILAAKADRTDPIERWTEEDVWRLWWLDLTEWCARRGLRPPDRLASSMLTLLDCLAATGALSPDSDPHQVLIEAMEGAGALWRGPRSRSTG